MNNIKLIIPSLLLTTAMNANAEVSFVSITDPESIQGTYQHTDGSLDSLYAAYDDATDIFSFKYDFTSSSQTQLGDAYFKFTNDGLLPNGNNGTYAIPTYKIDAQSGTLLIDNGTNSYTGSVDYSFDANTNLGTIAFAHDVSEVFDALGVDSSIANWSGGSFSSDFGIWSHVVDVGYFTLNSTGDFDTVKLTQDWIAFDPKTKTIETHKKPSVDVPEPSVMLLLMSGLGFIAVRRKKSA